MVLSAHGEQSEGETAIDSVDETVIVVSEHLSYAERDLLKEGALDVVYFVQQEKRRGIIKDSEQAN